MNHDILRLPMSEENVQNVRTRLEALNRGDLDAAQTLEGAAPDCVVDMTRALWGPYQGIHRIEEFRSVLEDIIGIWESARWDVAEYIERGEQVIAPTTGHFKGRDGVEVGAEMTWVYTFGDGLLQRITLYQDLDAALEAAGLSE